MIIYPCIIVPELFLIQVFKFLRSYDRHTKLYRIKHGIIIILKQGTVSESATRPVIFGIFHL